MSKGARNVDIGHSDITQPPERVKQASNAGVSRQCLEDKMSKGARNADIKPFLVFFTHLGLRKGVNM